MRNLRTALILCCGLSSASLAADAVYTAPAAADSGCKGYDVSPIIKSVDRNNDGKLTKEEWMQAKAPASSFQMMDRDKKDYIVPAQITASAPPPGMDTNHDCKITLAELTAMDGKTPMPGRAAGQPPAPGQPAGATPPPAPAPKTP